MQCAGRSGFPGGQLEWADVDQLGLRYTSLIFVFHCNLAIQQAACAISTIHKLVMTCNYKCNICCSIFFGTHFKHLVFVVAAMASPANVKKEPVVSHQGATPAPNHPDPSPKRRKVTDFRLAEKMEDTKTLREVLRATGRLVQWQNSDLVNVITLEALGLNSKLMSVVADFHCSQTQVVKPPGINFLKSQAGKKD